MKKALLLAATLAAMTATYAPAAVIIAAVRETSNASTSGYFDFSSPENTYASSGSYSSNPVPTNSNTDLANGITPTILSGSLHGVSGPVTNLTNGPAQTGDDQPGASTFSGDPITFRIDLGSDQAIAQFNSYTWHKLDGTGSRAQQVYTLLGAASNVADPTNLSLYTTIGSVNTTASPISFPWGGQQGVSFRSDTGTLGTFRYIAIQDSTTNGSFYGEFDVVAVPEPSSAVMLGSAGIALLAFRARSQSRLSRLS